METADSPSETLSQAACRRLQRDIVTGTLRPHARLGIRLLTESYGIGPTPIREALSRLSETGLIRARGRHGFAVAPLDRDDLADIVWLRRTVEAEALRRAMRDGGEAWEGEIVASLHHLRRAAAKAIGSPDPSAAVDMAFDDVHKRFHGALIAACGSERLLDLASRLYDQTFRYRRLAMRTPRWTQDVVVEHERLAELTLARDKAAIPLLDRHLGDVLAMAFIDDG